MTRTGGTRSSSSHRVIDQATHPSRLRRELIALLANTIEVRVHDASGQPLGTARWTLQATDLTADSYLVDPRIPKGGD